MKYLKFVGYGIVLLSLILFTLSFYNQSMLLFLLSIGVIVIGILTVIISMSLELFQKDKEIDYNAIKAQNLTLTTCNYCGKENILEDQYCRSCGEKLEEKNEI